MATKKSKPVYEVAVKVYTEVIVRISADNVQEAVTMAANLKVHEMIKEFDDSCDISDWENRGVSWVQKEDNEAFKL